MASQAKPTLNKAHAADWLLSASGAPPCSSAGELMQTHYCPLAEQLFLLINVVLQESPLAWYASLLEKASVKDK